MSPARLAQVQTRTPAGPDRDISRPCKGKDTRATETTNPVVVSAVASTDRILSLKQARAAVLEGITIDRKRNRLRILLDLKGRERQARDAGMGT